MWLQFLYSTVDCVLLEGTCMDKDGDKVITNHVCQHGGKNWPYWFRKMGLLASLVALLLLLLLLLVVVVVVVVVVVSSCSTSSSSSCIIIIIIINLDILGASLFSVITLHCAKELQASVGEVVPTILLYYFFKLVGVLQSSMTVQSVS